MNTSGLVRSIPNTVSWVLIGGQYYSETGAFQMSNGVVKRAQSRRLLHAPGDCPWDRPTCTAVGDAEVDGRLGILTVDTNNDGYVSANYDVECGVPNATLFLPGFIPPSAYFQDDPTCKTPNNPAHNSIITEQANNQGWLGTMTQQTPNMPNSMMTKLPFETVQQLVASLDSSDVWTEVVAGSPMQVARFQVTNLKIGGESYQPIGVYLKLWDWNKTGFDFSKEPGLKLALGWAANKLELLLARGATPRIEVELNHSVTLTRESLPQTMVMKDLTQASIDRMRDLATSNLRAD
jgi:hypothetical protein